MTFRELGQTRACSFPIPASRLIKFPKEVFTSLMESEDKLDLKFSQAENHKGAVIELSGKTGPQYHHDPRSIFKRY